MTPALISGILISAANNAWNPEDKASTVTLFNDNKVAGNNSGAVNVYSGVRGVKGRDTGRYYFEVSTTQDYISGDIAAIYAGLVSVNASLTVRYLFGDPPGAPYAVWRGNSQSGSDVNGIGNSGAGWGDVNGIRWIGFDCNLNARTIQATMNGVVRNTLTYGAGGGKMHPLGSIESPSTYSGTHLRLRTEPSEFLGTIPVGALAWASI